LTATDIGWGHIAVLIFFQRLDLRAGSAGDDLAMGAAG
jgi:hypothetical protein